MLLPLLTLPEVERMDVPDVVLLAMRGGGGISEALMDCADAETILVFLRMLCGLGVTWKRKLGQSL